MKKKSIYPSLIAKTLISCDSNLVYPLPIETGALPSGDHRVIVEVRIPTVVNPGKYSLRSVSVFSVNPVMQVVKSYTTPCFEVVK